MLEMDSNADTVKDYIIKYILTIIIKVVLVMFYHIIQKQIVI